MRLRAAALLFLAAGFPAAGADAPVRWNPAAPENRQVLPTFNYATVEGVLARSARASSGAGRPTGRRLP